GVEANAWNNLVLNFNGGNNIMGGSYGGTGYSSNDNIVVGPVDDTTRGGSGQLFIEVLSGGLPAALTAAGLDSNYKPEAGSPVLGVGGITVTDGTHSKTDILATIGNVDNANTARTNPPAVGALEADS